MEYGLVSVSFRGLSPEEIVKLCVENRLTAIEWGGDIHVPHGDLATAHRVRELTEKAGLTVSSYGSYYRAGVLPEQTPTVTATVETAVALGAPLIRIWAGNQNSGDASEQAWERTVSDCRALCEAAAAAGLRVCAECHGNTLTDEYHGALRLIEAVGCANFGMYWQPNQWRDEAYNRAAAEALRPWVTVVHTFQWKEDRRYPLAEGAAEWAEYRRLLGDAPSAYLLEFMPHDEPDELPQEAATLLRQFAAEKEGNR